jgi:hypothetical protein
VICGGLGGRFGVRREKVFRLKPMRKSLPIRIRLLHGDEAGMVFLVCTKIPLMDF